jgi:hypothetical protein
MAYREKLATQISSVKWPPIKKKCTLINISTEEATVKATLRKFKGNKYLKEKQKLWQAMLLYSDRHG